jgi:hypothetical protein
MNSVPGSFNLLTSRQHPSLSERYRKLPEIILKKKAAAEYICIGGGRCSPCEAR